MQVVHVSFTSRSLAPILSVITLSACAVAVEEPELSPLRSEDAWSDGQEVYVAKSDIDRVGAELMVQVVELLPGETPEVLPCGSLDSSSDPM